MSWNRSAERCAAISGIPLKTLEDSVQNTKGFEPQAYRILKDDIMAGARDPGAFAVMFAALAAVFGMTVAYAASKKRLPTPVYYIVCYLALAAAPTAYNYLTGSPLRSPLSLVFSGLPVAAIGVYFRAKRSKARTTEIPR